jgi:hypothetical protein
MAERLSPSVRRAAALGAARWLALAATPTFALMAVLTAAFGGRPADTICTAESVCPLNLMVVMYALMSAFHLPTWLRLISSA